MKKSELFFAFILLPIDIIMIVLSFVVAYYIRLGLDGAPAFNDIGQEEYIKYSFFLIPFWVLLFALNGLYYVKASGSLFNELYRIFSASSTAMLILIVGIFLTRSLFFSRLILIFTWVLAILLIGLGRIFIRSIRSYLLQFGVGRIRVLLIGDNETSQNIISILASKNNGFKMLGVLSSDGGPSELGLKICGAIDRASDYIKKDELEEVILTDINISKKDLMQIVQICYDNNITFKYIPDTLSLLALNTAPSMIGSMPVMELRSIPLDGWGRIAKRLLDLFFSLLMLLILSPIFLLISALIKLTSAGPVFYSQKRVGRDESIFYCHKFRSMVDGANKKKAWTTKESAELVTPIGKFLRKTNLDELPQLWDIFLGKMSFVGPRPEQPQFVEKFEKEIPDYFKRHKVKSGLTGWAQVNGLKGNTSINERVRYDMYYIENWSLWLDTKIVLKTISLIIYELFKGKYEYRSRS